MPPNKRSGPVGSRTAHVSLDDDETTVPPAADASALWQALADCPEAALHWAALGYRVGVSDGQQIELRRIGEAGRAVARGFGETAKRATFAEVTERRGTLRSCSCGRCSTCIHAEQEQRNLRRWGTADFPDAATRAAILAGAR